MRINKPTSRKVPTRRAYRPDQGTYRIMRKVTGRDRRKLLIVELTVIALMVAVVLAGLAYFLF